MRRHISRVASDNYRVGMPWEDLLLQAHIEKAASQHLGLS